jgi:3-hydroxybutyryl-CoA dehydrogenase
MVKNICVAGAGTMGRGIAQVSALAGFSTILYDLDPEMIKRAVRNIEDNLDQLSGKGR